LNDPLVSIRCATYNHKDLIANAIEGFLLQKINFSVEIIIYDDASDDGTTEILLKYKEAHPHIIPIIQKENQYSKNKIYQTEFISSQCKGKYIAMCDGDDYWTDPLKLQKQVDFLEHNIEWVGCYTKWNQYNLKIKKTLEIKNLDDFSKEDLLSYNYTRKHMCLSTTVWRNLYSKDTKKYYELCWGDYPFVTMMGLLYGGGCKFISDIHPTIFTINHGGNSWQDLSVDMKIEKVNNMNDRIYDAFLLFGNQEYINIQNSYREDKK
jgi:glycosyltransferase involved in cell wall biosynthesis